ncbi:MAG: hypothetical protein ACOX60_09125 [Massiliimalia sp.]|jgi:hypothetical protein
MNNLNPKAMNELIAQASKHIGTSPDQLRKQVENGKLEDIMKKLSPQQAQNFQNILNHPELAKRLMETPQAKAMMQKFFSQK